MCGRRTAAKFAAGRRLKSASMIEHSIHVQFRDGGFQLSARLKRTPLFIGLLAAFLAGAVIAPPLLAWLVTSFVELTGGERQTRPAVTQQDLLKLRGASDAQSEIELRSVRSGRIDGARRG